MNDVRPTATINVDVDASGNAVDRNIYGHFLESNFYGNIEGGVFDEGSPLAYHGAGVTAGLRRDVIEACRDLTVPIVRWPGGNFASGYHWTDGIGPREDRPRRLDLSWGGEESNRFGTDEFLAWCAEIGAEPYLVNPCRNVDEAVRWLEYTNYAGDTQYARERAKNGHPDPYRVRYWGIGNEVYGRWQMGHRGPHAYAADAREHAQFMRAVDPDLTLVAVGDGSEEWLRPLMSTAGNLIDYVSLHLYGASTHLYEGARSYADTVTQSIYFEDAIGACCSLLEHLADDIGIDRQLSIALDEWNMRHLEPADWPAPQPGPDGGIAPRDTPPSNNHELRVNRWSPRTVTDGLFYAGVLHALHRLSRRRIAPRMANTVNLINANALLAVRERGLVRSATYHVWDLYQNRLGHESVPVAVQGPARRAPVRQGDNRLGDGRFATHVGTIPALDAIATRGGRGLQIAVINREFDDTIPAAIRIGGDEPAAADIVDFGSAVDVFASNTIDHPDQVALNSRGTKQLDNGVYEFPPHSITVLSWPM